MKKILLLSLIASYSYGQSTLLTPGKAEVKADQIVVGNIIEPRDTVLTRLLIKGTKVNVGGSIAHLKSFYDPTAVYSFTGIKTEFAPKNAYGDFYPKAQIQMPYKASLQTGYGIKMDFLDNMVNYGIYTSMQNDAYYSNGMRINMTNNYTGTIGSNLPVQVGYYGTLTNSSFLGKTYGTQLELRSNGGNIVKIGHDLYINSSESSVGNCMGLNFLIEGSDPSNTSYNSGGAIANIVSGAFRNMGLDILVSGATSENTGLKVTAGGTSISRAAIFNGKIENNGFTRLGTTAPFIQQKEISGTMPAANVSQSFPHALTDANILSVSILANVSGQFIPPNYTGTATLEYNYYIAAGNIIILNKSGNSAALAGVPFKALITFKE